MTTQSPVRGIMSQIIHKTFGVNTKNGLQGYQFNYPYESCIFDKTNQRYAEYKRDCTDDFLAHSFVIDYMFFPKSILSLKWEDIKKAEMFYKTK